VLPLPSPLRETGEGGEQFLQLLSHLSDTGEGARLSRREELSPIAMMETIRLDEAEVEEVAGGGAAGREQTVPPSPTVIAFFNSKSGGQMGSRVANALQSELGESRVFDLSEAGKDWTPEDKLLEWKNAPNLRVLVCGGDGTAGWIFSCVDRTESQEHEFPVALMPLGTGNDLSRSFRWGPGFADSMLKPSFIAKVKTAKPKHLDRWLICVMPYEPKLDQELIKMSNIPPTFTVHEYSSSFGMESGSSVARLGRTFSQRMSRSSMAVNKDRIRSGRMFQNAMPTPDNATVVRGVSLDSIIVAEAVNEDDDTSLNEEVTQAQEAANEGTPATWGGVEEIAEGAPASLSSTGAAEAKICDDTPHGSDSLSGGDSARVPQLRPMPSLSVTAAHARWESYDGVFCNYYSMGVDAVAAAAFHEHREAHPELFTSRMRNQMWYVRKGLPAAGGIPCGASLPPPCLKEFVQLRIRSPGKILFEEVALDSSLRGIIILNLQSYGGGRNLWGSSKSSKYLPPACDDGILEIVGVSGILKMGCIMGCSKMGVTAQKIAQAEEVIVRVKQPIHMQIDGEPWKQDPSLVHIRHHARNTCLVPEKYA
jgi:hypothetical protein